MSYLVREFECCCVGLLSSKVTDRSKSSEKLSGLLCSSSAVQALNKSDTFTWNSVLNNVHGFLIKEAEKLASDELKKTISDTTYLKKKVYGDYLLDVVKVANQDVVRLDVSKLIEYVDHCFHSKCLRKHFSKQYILMLRDRVLSDNRYWGIISSEEWLHMYKIIKQLILKSVDDFEEQYYIECLALLIKWGPVHKFPGVYLRSEFDFVHNICLKLSEYKNVSQEKVIQLLIEFCKHMAKDCRMACCKLGEETFYQVLALYSTNSLDRVKLLVYEYFLLQMNIHHPKGASEESNLAFAVSWHTWLKCVMSLHQVLYHDLEKNLCIRLKNSGMFSTENGHKVVHPSFVNLMVEVCNQTFHFKDRNLLSSASDDGDGSPSKRQRIEKGFDVVIDKIRNTKDWPWINITTHLLVRYPELITSDQFTELLQILSELQAVCKDADMRYHLYECLTVLVGVQKHLNEHYINKNAVQSLWSVVWESALRAAGLNQNAAQTNKLLQKLLESNRELRQSSDVFRAYLSGTLKISEHSLSTLEVACCYCPLPRTVLQQEPTESMLMKLLLKNENSDVFILEVIARICVCLTMKRFPKCALAIEDKEKLQVQDGIENTYAATCMESGVLMEKDIKSTWNCSKSHIIDKRLFDELVAILENIQKESLSDENGDNLMLKIISAVILYFNTLSHILLFKILTEEELLNCPPYANLVKLLKLFTTLFVNFSEKVGESKTEAAKLKELLQLLKLLFHINIVPQFTYRLREVVPVEILQTLFSLLNNGNEKDLSDIHMLIVKTICEYCCVPQSKIMCLNQKFAMDALIPEDFNAESDWDYSLALISLSYLNYYELGTLEENFINSVLLLIEKICLARRNCHKTVQQILRVLYDLYPHVALCNSLQLRAKAVDLLQPFFTCQGDFSAEALVSLVRCMGMLVKLDETFTWASWGDKLIAREILEFIKADYQEIRLEAAKNVVFIFHQPTCAPLKQKIFEKLGEKCDEAFTIQNGGRDVILSEERRVDETVTRSASVMHTYGTIMAVLDLWRPKALLALLKVVHKRKLNVDTLRKMVKIVSKYLEFPDASDFIDQHLSCVVEGWYKISGSFDEFPSSLLGFVSETELYSNILPLIVPLLVEEEGLKNLRRISAILGRSIEDVIEHSFANIFSKCLPLFVDLQVTGALDSFNRKRAYQNLKDLLDEEKIHELLLSQLDKTVVSAVKSVFDADCYRDVLDDLDVVLFEPDTMHYSTEVLQNIIVYLEEKVTNSESLFSFCILKSPSLIQHILLDLRVSIYSAAVLGDKIRAFWHYTIIVDRIVSYLKIENPMQVFLVRDVVYGIINLINRESESHPQLAIFACVYLKRILQQILSDCTELIERLLMAVTSILVPIARQNSKIGDCCLDMLNYLIVDNAYVLLKAVESLDPFPEEQRFHNLSEVYRRIRYGNEAVTLEQEIRHFLNAGDSACRIEGLRHLKKQLSERKQEMKLLYEQLNEMRGFAEDAQSSLLHQLICTLLKLTKSGSLEVSTEAAHCLGELGPADLTTLVLQTDLQTIDFKYTHFELVTGRVLALFQQYIIDPDIEVVKATTSALYKVLKSKEARLVLGKDYGEGVIFRDFLLPFISPAFASIISQITIEEEFFKNRVDTENIWCPDRPCSHSEWITGVVCTLLETVSSSCYLSSLIPVCKAKVQFSERLLPLLVNLFIYVASRNCVQIICQHIRRFFEKHWMFVSGIGGTDSGCVVMNKSSVQCILDTVYFYRIQRSQIVTKKNSVGLELNYLHVAQAAAFCSAHFSVLLYTELWTQEQIEKIRHTHSSEPFLLDVTKLDMIYQEESEHIRKALQTILRNAYTAIGEMDALHYRTYTRFFSDEHYQDAGSLEEIQLVAIQSLHGSLSSIPPSLIDTLVCKGKPNDSQYECLWRLSCWDLELSDVIFEEGLKDSYEKLHYFALKALHEKDDFTCVELTKKARNFVIEDLQCASLESCKNLYGSLCKLQSLQELEDFFSARESSDLLKNLLDKWKQQDRVNNNEFSYVEPIKAQRITMLRDLLRSNGFDEIRKYSVDLQLDLAVLGRLEGNYNISTSILANLHQLSNLTHNDKLNIIFEEAQLCWAKGDKQMGKQMLRKLLNVNEIDESMSASVLKLYGSWMAETYSMSPQLIIKDYLLKSILVATNDHAFDTYYMIAKFADKEYQRILAYTKSQDYQRIVENVKKTRRKAEEIKRLHRNNEDERRAQVILERQSAIDGSKIKSTHQEMETFLNLAAKYYLHNLYKTDMNNMSVFRIASLFLENRNNANLKSVMDELLHLIPSYKYVTVLPQLVPHITVKKEDEFGAQITKIVLRCGKEHPHHTLPLLLALVHAGKDKEYCGSTANTDSNENRLQGAKFLLAKMRKDGFHELINNMVTVADSLIELAYCKTIKGKLIDIPRSCKIRKVKNMENVLLPTISLPIRKNANYANIVGIRVFGETYNGLDGINAPKCIKCQGTDGIWRTQLVKGKDDLRQDAVMQQVFNIMNDLLASNKQSNKLLIRTYKIVPLSMRSGILEWVENSIKLGEYLAGPSGAHDLYRTPSQYSSSVCRQKIKAIAKAPNEKKLEVFMDICKHFPPVFHKFFETSFPQPTVWYEKRRAYMHSVATSSMCGYILGIGDRHVCNILIDKKTAEVVHIDFGIAFEQGHVLPTPETVPFRLTRDIEDGMGVGGIEGVFRRACEKTMDVLRQNSQTIITILEVLLYDPLYSWTVSPAQAYSRQKEPDGTNATMDCGDEEEEQVPVNVSAERALLRLKEKLEGREDGNVASVESQVEKLLQQARNPENLCRLYCGWQAYL